MSRDKFFEFVQGIRENLVFTGGSREANSHNLLDRIIKITGGEKMTELTLQEDVARIIKRIKEAKENELLKEKADTVIEQLKKEL